MSVFKGIPSLMNSSVLRMALEHAARARSAFAQMFSLNPSPGRKGGRSQIDQAFQTFHEEAKAAVSGILEALVQLGRGDTQGVEAMKQMVINAEDTAVGATSVGDSSQGGRHR